MTLDRVRLPEDPCPCCGMPNNAASGVTGGKYPNPGDISVCLHCGHVAAFGDDLRHRELNDAEARYVAGNKEILALQKARGYVMSKKKI